MNFKDCSEIFEDFTLELNLPYDASMLKFIIKAELTEDEVLSMEYEIVYGLAEIFLALEQKSNYKIRLMTKTNILSTKLKH